MDFLSVSLTAFGLGVFHALEPGHGKTLMAGSLVGSTRRWRDPLSLAVSTATGHAVGIILFVTISFFIAHELAVDELRHFIELSAGIIVVLCGASLFYNAFRLSKKEHGHHTCCSCACGKKSPSTKHLPLVGFLIGLVPCPSAMAVSLSATKIGSFGQAMFLSFLFAFGVAVTLSSIGIVITHSSYKIGAASQTLDRLKRFLPFISPVMVTALGVVMIIHSSAH